MEEIKDEKNVSPEISEEARIYEEGLHRRRIGLTARLCAALVLLALAFVLKEPLGEPARQAVNGALTEKMTVTECLSELGKKVSGWFTHAGEEI